MASKIENIDLPLAQQQLRMTDLLKKSLCARIHIKASLSRTAVSAACEFPSVPPPPSYTELMRD